MNPTSFDVFKRLSETLLDQGFRGEDYFVVLQFDFKVITRFQPESVMNLLGNNYLSTGSNFND